MRQAAATTVVGIDAGGSSVRARASRNGVAIFEQHGDGSGNPRTVTGEALRSPYEEALAGCPPASQVVACVAGAGAPDRAHLVTALLSELVPGADVRVFPDYVGAFHAQPDGTDVCVVAGTGSVVCSRNPEGGFTVSGGRGWILGDAGSAAKLGQLLLNKYVDEPTEALDVVREQIAAALGVDDWRDLIALIHTADAPAALMAKAAPILTGQAEDGDPWARSTLAKAMAELAATVARHLRDHIQTSRPAIGLAGGIWRSNYSVFSFADALSLVSPNAHLVSCEPADPMDGVVRMAERGLM